MKKRKYIFGRWRRRQTECVFVSGLDARSKFRQPRRPFGWTPGFFPTEFLGRLRLVWLVGRRCWLAARRLLCVTGPNSLALFLLLLRLRLCKFHSPPDSVDQRQNISIVVRVASPSRHTTGLVFRLPLGFVLQGKRKFLAKESFENIVI